MENKRDYTISRRPGEWYQCMVRDSYGSVSINYFETEQECINQVYYVWEHEDNFRNMDDVALLRGAIQECKEIDVRNGKRPIL